MEKWIRICLPVQQTQVQPLVREDSTCHWSKPLCHIYWACVLQLLNPPCLEPVLWNKRSPCCTTKSSPHSTHLEKARTKQWRSSTAKNKIKARRQTPNPWHQTPVTLGTYDESISRLIWILEQWISFELLFLSWEIESIVDQQQNRIRHHLGTGNQGLPSEKDSLPEKLSRKFP